MTPSGDGEIRYARHGDGHLAYRTWGNGPPLLWVPSQFIPISAMDDEPAYERFLMGLASFATVIVFDRLGVGLSDPMPEAPTIDDWTAQLVSVITAAGFDAAFLLAHGFGGVPAVTLAATRPERVRGLVLAMGLNGAIAEPETLAEITATARPDDARGAERFMLEHLAPSRADDPAFRRWWDDAGRRGASPAVAQALLTLQAQASATEHVNSVTAPTLVITRPGYRGFAPVRLLQMDVPGARRVEVDGVDVFPWLPDSEAIVAEVEDFVTGQRHAGSATRALLAVMFSDVVESTPSAVRLGDRQWTDLLEVHDRTLRREVERAGGTEIDSAGDGFLMTFPTPSQAVRCATRLHRAIDEIGLRLRIGIHCGELELRDAGIAGIAVHIAARVQSKADPGETLVTSATKDIITGSGVQLNQKGRYALKGVPGRWVLYVVDQ
jgi:class 3 adenylate cyclase